MASPLPPTPICFCEVLDDVGCVGDSQKGPPHIIEVGSEFVGISLLAKTIPSQNEGFIILDVEVFRIADCQSEEKLVGLWYSSFLVLAVA